MISNQRNIISNPNIAEAIATALPALKAKSSRPIHETKEEVVYRAVQEAIISGLIPPGAHLVVAEVAKAAQTSAIPVRNALRRLEHDGLVEVVPHVGSFVTELPIRQLTEALALREVLEEYAVQLASDELTSGEVGRLEELCDAMDDAADGNDVTRFAELNGEFHAVINEASRNATLLEVLGSLTLRSKRGRAAFAQIPERMHESQREHRELLAALRDGDSDRASRLAREHRSASRRAIEALPEH